MIQQKIYNYDIVKDLILQKMKQNFTYNQIFYIKGIGYARLAIQKQKDGKNNQVVLAADNNNNIQAQDNEENNDSVLFDPQMFRIDSDSPFADNQIVNITEQNTRKKSIQIIRRQSTQIKNRQLIVLPLKLQNIPNNQSPIMIYCPQNLLLRKITIYVKSLLQNSVKQIPMQIQITKTIDNFKILIFKQLGEDINLYSDIKIYTTTHRIQQLNMNGTKTIAQCQLKDKAKITITGKFNFTFKNNIQGFQDKYQLSNNNNTVAWLQKKQAPSTTATSTNTTATTTTNTTTSTTVNATDSTTTVQQKKVQQQQPNTQNKSLITQTKPQSQQPPKAVQQQKTSQKQINPIQNKPFHLQSNGKIRSGIHYWQIKIDKLNTNKDNNTLLIGICLKSEQSGNTRDYIHLWAFDPIRSRKVEISNYKKLKIVQTQQKQQKMADDKQQAQQGNGSDESDEQYGCHVKNGDIVGILLIIKERRGRLIFYKNSTCLQECYEFNTDKLKLRENKYSTYLCPFVNIKGEIQLSIDSRAQLPLDAYRFK